MNAALPQRKIQERSGRVFKPVAFSFANPQQGRCRHIHHKALESEREKAEIAWNRHLKNLPALKHGENVMPFGSSPVIPEFPKPTAGKSGREQGIKAGAASCAKSPIRDGKPRR